jgi:penicillin-binding protein 1A
MADAYLTLQTKGLQVEPRVISRILQGDSVLVDDRPKTNRVLDQAVAEKVNYALQQVVDEGSGAAAAIPQAQVRGKTGTTDVYGDAWFVGYTSKLTTAVWMGYPEGQSKPLLNIHGVAKVNGGSLPAQIFQRYMSKASPADDAPPAKAPDLTGKTLAPVDSLASSSSGGGSTAVGSSGGSSSNAVTTTPTTSATAVTRGPSTTVEGKPAPTVPEPTTPPTSPTPATTEVTTPVTIRPPRTVTTFTLPPRPDRP